MWLQEQFHSLCRLQTIIDNFVAIGGILPINPNIISLYGHLLICIKAGLFFQLFGIKNVIMSVHEIAFNAFFCENIRQPCWIPFCLVSLYNP